MKSLTWRSCLMYAIAMSNLFMAQYAELRADKTEPRNFIELVPIWRAASNTTAAAAKWLDDSNSCPTTDVITNGDNEFITCNWR